MVSMDGPDDEPKEPHGRPRSWDAAVSGIMNTGENENGCRRPYTTRMIDGVRMKRVTCHGLQGIVIENSTVVVDGSRTYYKAMIYGVLIGQ